MLNKVTGLLLFLLPLTVPIVDFRYSSMAVCALATVSAVQESIHIIKKEDSAFGIYRQIQIVGIL